MGETGIGRFPGNLDPRAQEFRPGNPNQYQHLHHHHHQAQLCLFPQPPQPLYYPYTTPFSATELQVVPFCEAGVGYIHAPQQQHPHPAYVSSHVVQVAPVLPPSAAATRTLVLSSVPSDVGEGLVRRELESFGEVRAIEMERIQEGIVTVHFYDLRHADKALREIRDQHMQHQARLRNHYCPSTTTTGSFLGTNSGTHMDNFGARGLIAGRPVWAHFVIPFAHAFPDGHNQGTIVIFNLDSQVSKTSLKEIFDAFGPVKELRETPSKKHQRFVEFYDVRDAAKALKEMNGKEISGKAVVIEFSRPGGHSRKFFNTFTSANPAAISANVPVINSTSINYHIKSPKYPSLPPPPPPPPPPPRKFSGRFSPNVRPRPQLSQTPFSSKKSNFSKGSPKGSANSEGSLEAKMMTSLNLGNGIEEKEMNGPTKRNGAKKSQSSNTAIIVTTTKLGRSSSSNRPWKGRQAKKFDTRFLINEDSSNGRDSRTTVMIKNIPNKYSQKLLLNMLDNHCIHCNEQIGDGDDQPLSSYDFVYLPIDFNNKCNVGYGFVNMTSPQATWRLYKAFHLQHWEVFNSRKICEVTYARVQGLEALKEHFKNSKFPCEMDHYLPVVFSPPREGKQLTEPFPIVGHNKHPISTGLHSSKASVEDDDDDEMDGQDRLEDEEEEEEEDGGGGSDDFDVDQHDVLLDYSNSCSSSNSYPNGGVNGDEDDDIDVDEDRGREERK
ncbi:protein terminal ear1 homolog [Quercus robur]|uniref:protein terminal ear1 homolog n=1 Tax=Quercus robur TaxID=38942 RepID=UPI002163FCCB|nr:protein terminal ear1 homolog [Quercus robur]